MWMLVPVDYVAIFYDKHSTWKYGVTTLTFTMANQYFFLMVLVLSFVMSHCIMGFITVRSQCTTNDVISKLMRTTEWKHVYGRYKVEWIIKALIRQGRLLAAKHCVVVFIMNTDAVATEVSNAGGSATALAEGERHCPRHTWGPRRCYTCDMLVRIDGVFSHLSLKRYRYPSYMCKYSIL